MLKSTFFLLVPALALAAAACSTDPGAPTPESACSAYLDAQVARANRCRTSSSEVTNNEFKNYCSKLLSAPGMGLSPSRITQCATQLRDAGCERSESDITECNSRDVKGTLADDVACASDLQCASGNCKGGDIEDDGLQCGKCAPSVAVGGTCGSGLRCVADAVCVTRGGTGGAPTTSTCVQRVVVNEGASCANESPDKRVECAPGLRCSFGTETPVCKKLLALGAACKTGECGGSLACIAGTCQVRGGEGTTCEVGDECASGFTCDRTAKKCTKIVEIAEGQSCATSTLTQKCATGTYCKTVAGTTTTRTCTAYKAAGAACDATQDRCAPFTVCSGGVCSVPDAATCK
jgi:hypothetical protein